jgi:hypothetical protein
MRALRMKWYYAGLAGVGAAVGLFTGLSSSPVVGVLLPLLFALIGGAGGLYLATADLSKSDVQLRLDLLGKGFVVLAVPLVGAAVYASLVRTGASWSTLFLIESRAEAADLNLEQMRPAHATELFVLRRKLELLGVPGREQQVVLRTAAADIESPRSRERVVASFKRLATLSTQASTALEAELGSISDDEGAHSAADVLRLVRSFAGQYAHYAGQLADGRWLPMTSIQQRLDEDRERLTRTIHDDPVPSWLLRSELPRTSLWNLEIAFIEESAASSDDWRSDGRQADALNQFFEATAGGGRTSAEAPVLRPAIAR